MVKASIDVTLVAGAIAGLLFGARIASADDPDPKQIRIEAVSYNGPGCPMGSASALLSSDARALTLLFDRFTATTESGGHRDFKACSVDLQMRVPNGWSFGIFRTQVRGYVDIHPGSLGTQRSRYTFGGQRLSVSAREIRGPFTNDYQHDESVPLPNIVYSPCGGGRNLAILTSLEVSGPSSHMTVDSLDGELRQVYGIHWKRCGGSQTIGPAPISPGFSQARAIDADTGRDVFGLVQAYAHEVRVGLHVAACDLNGDKVADLVTGTGQGVAPHVRVFDGRNGSQLAHPLGSFFAYATAFLGGVTVGCGDVNGDGRDDLITGAGPGAGPHVIAWSGTTGAQLKSFFAYDQRFQGGVWVATTDFNGDRVSDIVTGAGPGGRAAREGLRRADASGAQELLGLRPGFPRRRPGGGRRHQQRRLRGRRRFGRTGRRPSCRGLRRPDPRDAS